MILINRIIKLFIKKLIQKKKINKSVGYINYYITR